MIKVGSWSTPNDIILLICCSCFSSPSPYQCVLLAIDIYISIYFLLKFWFFAVIFFSLKLLFSHCFGFVSYFPLFFNFKLFNLYKLLDWNEIIKCIPYLQCNSVYLIQFHFIWDSSSIEARRWQHSKSQTIWTQEENQNEDRIQQECKQKVLEKKQTNEKCTQKWSEQ